MLLAVPVHKAASGSDTEKEAHKPIPEMYIHPQSKRSPDPDAWVVLYKPNKISAGLFPISDRDDWECRTSAQIVPSSSKTSSTVSTHFLNLNNLSLFS